MKSTMRKMSVLVLIAGLAVATPLRAQKQTAPEGGPAKAFSVPANETYTLANGMKVTLVPYGIIPKVTVSASIDAGSMNEGSDGGKCDQRSRAHLRRPEAAA